MAQVGFPWHAQAQKNEASDVSEKDSQLVPSTSRNSAVLSETTNQKAVSTSTSGSKQKSHGSVKKRSDSVKTNAIARQQVRFQAEPSKPREPVKRFPVRTIPPWIQDADEDDLLEAGLILPNSPGGALLAQHNHTPSATQRPLLYSQLHEPKSGQYPTSSGGRRSEPVSRWISFARASAYPREQYESEKVEPEWLNENFTDYSKPWLADHNDDDVEDGSDKYRAFRRKRRSWYKRIHFAIMRNPFIPLGFRLFVIIFAATAMALGASIFHENDIIIDCIAETPGVRTSYCASRVGQGSVQYDRDPSALMAIIVDAVAIAYSAYITYDEYFSKPLGLRPPGAKVRLVLLDIFFIVFQSANLSLAFNSISVDQGPCKTGVDDLTSRQFKNVCDRAESLSAVLLVSLVAWLLTFSVSILRLVERINAR